MGFKDRRDYTPSEMIERSGLFPTDEFYERMRWCENNGLAYLSDHYDNTDRDCEAEETAMRAVWEAYEKAHPQLSAHKDRRDYTPSGMVEVDSTALSHEFHAALNWCRNNGKRELSEAYTMSDTNTVEEETAMRAVWEVYQEHLNPPLTLQTADFHTQQIEHPTHYTSGPKHSTCGTIIECIDVVEALPFNRGAAMKYLWRAGLKDDELQDLKKCAWYINREIERLEENERNGN